MINYRNDTKEMLGDATGQIKRAAQLLVDPSEAPPNIREQFIAFVPLFQKTEDNQLAPLGCFVAEIYELAKVKSLKCQIEYKEWKALQEDAKGELEDQPFYTHLFNQNGVKKTAFELGLLPFTYDNNKQKSKNPIREHLEKEFNFIRKHNYRVNAGLKAGKIIRLPAPINKYRIAPEYLKYIERVGLVAKGSFTLTLNISNPAGETTKFERALHWVAQRSSLLLTLGAAFTASYMSFISLPVAAVAVGGIVLAKWCANEFGNFDLAEKIYREADWLMSKELRQGERLSVKKLIRTGALFAAVGIGALVAGIAGWEVGMVFALPNVTTMGAAIASSIIQYSTASLFATIGFLGTLTGMSTQRFFWGASIWDNQIQLTPADVAALPVLELPVIVPPEVKADPEANAAIKEMKQAREAAIKEANEAYQEGTKSCLVRFEARQQALRPTPLVTNKASNDVGEKVEEKEKEREKITVGL